MRCAITALVLVAVAGPAVAQDMPLFTFTKLGAKWEKAAEPANPDPPGAVTVTSKDGATAFVGYPDRAAVWAFPMKDGQPDLTAGAPYAPLRIVAGYDNSREARESRKAKPPTLAVTALLIDPAGRIYAATAKDIQVFDPTGRLCGSLPLPGGPVRELRWRAGPSPALLADAGGVVWARPMR